MNKLDKSNKDCHTDFVNSFHKILYLSGSVAA